MKGRGEETAFYADLATKTLHGKVLREFGELRKRRVAGNEVTDFILK